MRPEQAAPEHPATEQAEHGMPRQSAPTQHDGNPHDGNPHDGNQHDGNQHGGAQRWEPPQPQGVPPEQRTAATDQRMPADQRTRADQQMPTDQRTATGRQMAADQRTAPEGAHPGPGTSQAQHGASDGAGARADSRGGAGSSDGAPERLVPADHAASYQSRWNEVKGAFVDEPRAAVAQADALVGELLDELETLFREQRRSIEQGLDADETSTEDLRVALRRYRSFFDRLLAL